MAAPIATYGGLTEPPGSPPDGESLVSELQKKKIKIFTEGAGGLRADLKNKTNQ